MGRFMRRKWISGPPIRLVPRLQRFDGTWVPKGRAVFARLPKGPAISQEPTAGSGIVLAAGRPFPPPRARPVVRAWSTRVGCALVFLFLRAGEAGAGV